MLFPIRVQFGLELKSPEHYKADRRSLLEETKESSGGKVIERVLAGSEKSASAEKTIS